MHQPIAVCQHSRIRSHRRFARLVLCALLATGVAFTLTAQSSSNELSFADSLQRLERQPEHPQFFERLTETALLADSPGLASEILLKHRHRIRRAHELAEIDLLLGRFSQIRSDLSGALEYFSAAAAPDTPVRARALSSLAALQLELGEVEAALSSAQQSLELIGSPSSELSESNGLNTRDPEFLSWERSVLTQTSALAALGRADEAQDLLEAKVNESSRTATPALLLRLIELASEQGKHDVVEKSYDTLVASAPDSPERRLAARYREGGTEGVVGAGLVEYFPSPSRLLSGGSPELATRREPSVAATPDTPSRAEPADPPEPGASTSRETDTQTRGVTSARSVYGVQTGSFRDAENAEYMVRDLEDRNFAARQRSRTVGENEFHQVYVPVAGADPQEILVRLKEVGFEGFLLFE
ncbi:MAG: hypothetical protein EA428_12460 [Spirochaetaceae bacterium]|nr:MAG: hypothetical protein EA428_12460 [Spirochaetaceae bacterium]